MICRAGESPERINLSICYLAYELNGMPESLSHTLFSCAFLKVKFQSSHMFNYLNCSCGRILTVLELSYVVNVRVIPILIGSLLL